MLSRSAFGRQAQRSLRQQLQQPAGRRGLAAPASGSFQYETGNAAGLKFAARDITGPTTHLAIVSQAGTRFETLPGLTVGLQSYAFKVIPIYITIRAINA
jgi:ubiquinol-cytochrome c reductase core subunit 2